MLQIERRQDLYLSKNLLIKINYIRTLHAIAIELLDRICML